MASIYTILGVTAGALILAVIALYNSLAVLRNRIENAWSQIDVQLKKRYDLVPNLINTVKGYAKHEKDVFMQVTKARAAAMGATDMKAHAKAENMLSNTLKSLFAVAENYPQLRASENFKMLQEELSGIENKIAYSRQFYNDQVLSYDNRSSKFPGNIVAKVFGFKPREYFQMQESEKANPKVEF